jgi:hypothetical protein
MLDPALLRTLELQVQPFFHGDPILGPPRSVAPLLLEVWAHCLPRFTQLESLTVYYNPYYAFLHHPRLLVDHNITSGSMHNSHEYGDMALVAVQLALQVSEPLDPAADSSHRYLAVWVIFA